MNEEAVQNFHVLHSFCHTNLCNATNLPETARKKRVFGVEWSILYCKQFAAQLIGGAFL